MRAEADIPTFDDPDPSNAAIVTFLDVLFAKPKPTPKIEFDRWHKDDLTSIWQAMSELKADPDIPKTEILRTLIMLSGLDQAEAAKLLKLAPQSLRQKLSGKRPITEDEVGAMVLIYRAVRENALKEMPEGATTVFKVTQWLKGH